MAFAEPPVVGYHKIRGLGGPLRMMCCYKGQPYVNWACGADMKESWFASKKPELIKANSCINLPFIQSGDELVTQSNTCAVYLGQKLGIDTPANMIKNHTVLDQVMDLRNDLMKVVYPFGSVKTKEEFPAAAKDHLAKSATGNFTKLEGFCVGPYMCGAEPQSGDFALFEMFDQHLSIAASLGDESTLAAFPKLQALHAAMKADPKLASYFASDQYAKWAQNNGLLTHFTGQGADFEYGASVNELFTP